MTSAQPAHPDCDSPGAGRALGLRVWLSTGPSSDCFPSFSGDPAAPAAFAHLWVFEITERGRGVGPRLNQVTLPSLVPGDTFPLEKLSPGAATVISPCSTQ